LIGTYFNNNPIEEDGSGYSGIYSVGGNKFGSGSATYTFLSGRGISLYATGDTGGLNIAPPSITSTLAFGTTKINLNIAVSGIASTVVIGSHTVTRGAVNIAPNGIASTVSIGSATITQGWNIYPSSIASTLTVGTPTLVYNQSILPDSIVSTVSIGEPVITSGQSIYPGGIDSTITFGSVYVFLIPPPARKYILEVRNSSGDLISILENAYNKSYSERVNEPAVLSFSIPADDDKKDDLVLPNEIWLRNYETGDIKRKFVLTHSGKVDDGTPHITIEAKSYLSKLLQRLYHHTLHLD
jgi:hypothetical protein